MEIQNLSHKKFGKIRVVIFNGKVYFLAIDVAAALGFKDTSKAVRNHVQAQDKTTFRPDALSGHGAAKIPYNAFWINESGMYSLVMRSKLPLAQEFQHWITSEVIPAIMNDGYYINPHAVTPAAAPIPPVNENELTRREKISILEKCLDYTDCKNLRNKLIYDIAYLVTNKIY